MTKRIPWFPWNEERLELMKRLRAKGWTSRAIAQEIGCTVNQVRYKIDQIGADSLPTGFHRKIQWTSKMVETLTAMRNEGRTYLECCEAIGVDQMVVARKCKELGLNARMNCGKIRGIRREA